MGRSVNGSAFVFFSVQNAFSLFNKEIIVMIRKNVVLQVYLNSILSPARQKNEFTQKMFLVCPFVCAFAGLSYKLASSVARLRV